jgi:hypothetical protein
MPDWERIARGRDFEGRVRDVLGARLVSNSGAGRNDKSDVKGLLRVSCKAEATKSWNRIREQLAEAIGYAFGTSETPALATLDDDGAELIIMRLEDFSKLLSSGVTIQPVQSRGDLVQQNAEIPSILRQ